MKSGNSFIALGLLVLALSLAPTASAVLTVCDGSHFHEHFNGGVFSEGTTTGYGVHGSAFYGANAGFNEDAGRVINANYIEAEIAAEFSSLGPDADYTVEAVVRVSSAYSISENAFIMELYSELYATAVGVKLEAKEVSGGWDVEVADAGGTSLAGLNLSYDEYHSVAQRHLGNGTIALYVDGNFIANYTDREPTEDFIRIQYGNVSATAGVGFGTAWFNDMAVGGYVPEPATMALLALGGLSLLRRRS